ncbi:MAG: lysylphosphatidylglycerol synthase transmembrane domain-containing protein [Bacteroidales bacterium]
MSNKTSLFRNLFFVIGAATILFMVYKIGFQEIYDNLQKTGWWFAAILGIWVVVYMINAVSFQLIIRDGSPESKKISFWRTLKLVISGYAINYTTPMGLLGGEPYRVMELKPALGVKKATSAVILYAMMHFVSHLILWIMSVLLIILYVPITQKGLIIALWCIFIACFLLILWAFKGYKKGMVFKLFTFLAKIPFIKKKVTRYKNENEAHLKEIDELISDLYLNRKGTFFASLFAELVSRLVSCWEIFFMLYSIGQDVTYVQCVIVVALASLFANLLFFSPMQLGTREGGYAIAFSSLSLPGPLGVYVSLCTRIRELFWIFIGISIMKYKSLK